LCLLACFCILLELINKNFSLPLICVQTWHLTMFNFPSKLCIVFTHESFHAQTSYNTWLISHVPSPIFFWVKLVSGGSKFKEWVSTTFMSTSLYKNIDVDCSVTKCNANHTLTTWFNKTSSTTLGALTKEKNLYLKLYRNCKGAMEHKIKN